ncbi:MAG: YggS family pyridoxal phosphate-dependent enzyme [Sutterella sp.]|nr:YggS family pyridoxal phosphate-dependent enzyme [Sutterella sp.]
MSTFIPGIEERLAALLNEIENAPKLEKRITLLAVSKTFPKDAVLIAAQAGQRSFGENYAQEGCEKVDWFRENHAELPLVWHFIGPVQANKTRPIAEHFDWVESLNREKIARRLNEQRPEALGKLNVLIEVNIDGEASKSGVLPKDVPALCDVVQGLDRLKLRGLMAIPAPADTHEGKIKPLRDMRALYESLRDRYEFDTLSMGMSADYLEALEAGSTEIRVGTAIFGHRDYSAK